MATNFPTSLDTFTNPSSGNTLDSPSHSGQHSDINDAVEAIETKLGIGNSPAGSATSGYVLTAGTGGTTTWSALPASGGLIQVVPTSVAVGSGSGSVDANGAVTFSSVSSISINGCFSATYDNYKLMVNITVASADTYLYARLRASGSDITTSNYNSAVIQAAFGSTTLGNDAGGTSQSAWNRFGWLQSGTIAVDIPTEICNPFLSARTSFQNFNSRSGYGHQTAGGTFNTTTTADGITIYPLSGTISGTIRVYGYRN